MNCLVRGSIVFAAAASVWACGTNLDENGDQLDHLTATPSVVMVANTDSQTVDIEALNPQGNQLVTDFELTTVGAGINVRLDSAYQPIGNGVTNPTRARFVVRATDPTSFVSTSFTVTGGGKEITVPVNITPAALPADFSNANPGVGDTVTITAPSVLRFTPELAATAGAVPVSIISVSADSLTAQVVFGPGANATNVTFDNVVVTYLPGIPFDGVVTTGTITTPAVGTFTLGINNLNPSIGAPLTVTIPAPFKWTSNSHIKIPHASTLVTSVSADSSTVNLLIGPNADSVLAIDSLIVSGVPGLGRFTLGTTGTVVSPVLNDVDVTYSNSNPAGGDPITLTAPAGYKFFPSLQVTVNGIGALVESVAADSNTAVVIPQPGASGTVVVTNFGATGSPLPLSLPATNTLDVGASPFSVSNPFSASIIAMPSSGNTLTYYDGGGYFVNAVGDGERYYRVSLAAPATIDASLLWDNTTDMGLYVIDDAFTTILDAADSFGNQNKGPETATFDLAAGDYIFAVVRFGTGANVYRMRFTTQ